jgi:hypothetical protein
VNASAVPHGERSLQYFPAREVHLGPPVGTPNPFG